MNAELESPSWQDTTRSAEDRVSALMDLMTLEEKVGQVAGELRTITTAA